jgi:hypothetical protein
MRERIVQLSTVDTCLGHEFQTSCVKGTDEFVPMQQLDGCLGVMSWHHMYIPYSATGLDTSCA